eukprot:558134-Amorphochlora_amoeboformis.AAC.1
MDSRGANLILLFPLWFELLNGDLGLKRLVDWFEFLDKLKWFTGRARKLRRLAGCGVVFRVLKDMQQEEIEGYRYCRF